MTNEEKRRTKKDKEMRAQISYGLTKIGYTKRQLATEMGLSEATLYNKIREPSKFSIGELRDLICILQITNEVKTAIV